MSTGDNEVEVEVMDEEMRPIEDKPQEKTRKIWRSWRNRCICVCILTDCGNIVCIKSKVLVLIYRKRDFGIFHKLKKKKQKNLKTTRREPRWLG